MRPLDLALALLLVAALLAPAISAGDSREVGQVSACLPGDYADVDCVNKLVSVEESPSLAPGESGRFVFVLNVTYTEPVRNVTLRTSIYRYATVDESVAVNESWPYPYPKIAETGTREWTWIDSLVAPGARRLNFTILTAPDSRDMPHGTVFSQSSYFLRFELLFEGNVSGTSVPFRMASRGFFTDAQWKAATIRNATDPCTTPWCRGNVNLTLLGVDGIIPDSAFGVKDPIPRWPFYALIAAAILFLVLAFLFWVEENPGSYPRIESWWARTRGRFARTVATLRSVRRPRT